MTIYNSSKEKAYGLADQSTWGTARTADTVFLQLHVEDTMKNDNTNVRDSNNAARSKNPTVNDLKTDNVGVMPELNLSGVATKEFLDSLIYLFFQAVVEGATTPFDKTFALPNDAPAFDTSAGYFVTLVERMPIASTSRMMQDVICKKLTLTWSPGEYLNFSADLIGRGFGSNIYNPSVDWGTTTHKGYHYENLNATYDIGGGDVDINLVGDVVLDLGEDAQGVGVDGSGEKQSIVIVNRNDMTFSMIVNNDAAVTVYQTQKDTSALTTFKLRHGNATPGTVDGDLYFEFQGHITLVEPDNSDTSGYKVEGKIIQDSDVVAAPITAIMANAIDKSW